MSPGSWLRREDHARNQVSNRSRHRAQSTRPAATRQKADAPTHHGALRSRDPRRVVRIRHPPAGTMRVLPSWMTSGSWGGGSRGLVVWLAAVEHRLEPSAKMGANSMSPRGLRHSSEEAVLCAIEKNRGPPRASPATRSRRAARDPPTACATPAPRRRHRRTTKAGPTQSRRANFVICYSFLGCPRSRHEQTSKARPWEASEG